MHRSCGGKVTPSRLPIMSGTLDLFKARRKCDGLLVYIDSNQILTAPQSLKTKGISAIWTRLQPGLWLSTTW